MALKPGLRLLLVRHWQGIAHLENGADGRPRYVARSVLYGLPPAAAVLSWRPLHLDLSGVAGSLVAGFSLIAASLIAVFVQFALWRMRLDERASARPTSEAPVRRAIDVAVAHCLVGTLASLFALVAAITLDSLAEPNAVLTAILTAASLYVVGLFTVIVSAAFVAYEGNVDRTVRRADDQLKRTERTFRVVGGAASLDSATAAPPA